MKKLKTLKEVLKELDIKELKELVPKYYPKVPFKGFNFVYKQLESKRSRKWDNEMEIDIEWVEAEECYYHVSGINKKESKRYSLTYATWSYWLGLPLSENTLKQYSAGEIAMHCIWEMTFLGFTEARVNYQRREFKRRIKQSEEDIKQGKYLTMEEVFEKLKEKTNFKEKSQ